MQRVPQGEAMDPRVHIDALREKRLMVSAVCRPRGTRGGNATKRGGDGLLRPSKRPARHDRCALTGDGRRDQDRRRDQGVAAREIYHRRARAAANNRAVQRFVCLRKQRDQSKLTDHDDRDHSIIRGSGGVDSEEDEIEPLRTASPAVISARS